MTKHEELVEQTVEYAKGRVHGWRHNDPAKRPKEIRALDTLVAEISRLSRELEEATKQQREIIFAEVEGRDIDEWRENVRKTELYQRGDTKLYWLNEGDLYMKPFRLARSILDKGGEGGDGR